LRIRKRASSAVFAAKGAGKEKTLNIEHVKCVVGDLPNMSLKQAKTITTFITSHEIREWWNQ
jgi:hypothetical protein